MEQENGTLENFRQMSIWDHVAYCVLFLLSLLLSVIAIKCFDLFKLHAYQDPEVIAVVMPFDMLNIFLWFPALLCFSFSTLALPGLYLSCKYPLFKKSGIQYGSEEAYPHIPLFLSSAELKECDKKELRKNRISGFFWIMIAILCLLLLKGSIGRRICLYENGDIAMYNVRNECTVYHSVEKVDYISFEPYRNYRGRSRSVYDWDLAMSIKMESWQITSFHLEEFRDDEISSLSETLKKIGKIKNSLPVEKIRYKDSYRVRNIVIDQDLTCEDQQTILDFFSKH